MLTCPVCDTLNEDGSVSCERCNCAFGIESAETIASANPLTDQPTIAATGVMFRTDVSGAAPARATLPSSAAELPVGHLLVGRYEIQARLGQGGMGTVYKVLDRELDRVVALKTIRPDLSANPNALHRLKQETLLARQIAHRNVIRVFDLGVADSLRFITMELVEGEDLRTLLDRHGKLPLEDTINILLQICDGLIAAHTEDVVHRDLKPQNVLISAGQRVRIVDFGLARSFANTGMTNSGVILGTPAYMSPEQALGQQGDSRSDFFSLGVMGFELLTGELPFPSRTLSEALTSRIKEKARPIESVAPEVPAWFARILMRCLERSPADRYATAAEMAADLRSRDVCLYPSAEYRSGNLSPGAMVGSRYRIEAEVGEGGIGKVYRATDLDLHRTVALKVVRPDLASSADVLDQLMHEISMASQISHKNVLRIHDLGEASGLRFVSMAWAEGEDLRSLLHRTGPLPENRLLELASDICEGLEAAHEQGISHRDLKPSNILLTSGGHACIADFGLARHTHSSSDAAANPSESAHVAPAAASASVSLSGSAAVGTPRYMSPEQVDGVCIDHRTDIYSLGLMLYEMGTGRIPFSDDSAFQTMAQRLTERPASPRLLNPLLSERLANITLRCLEREPEKRYASVRELLDDLRWQPSAEPAPLVGAPAKKRWFARPWTWGIAAALVVGAAAGLFWQRRAPSIEPPINGKYIAVLPFHPVGADPNLKYRAEGVADAIAARLSSLASLHPVSASAIERVNLSQPDDAVGKQLGANLLVKGWVQSIGDHIRIDASIYNREKHQFLWHQTYEGNVADLFTLEDNIANDAVRALNVNPTLEERERQAPAPTQSLAAYDLYLKGRDILKKGRDEASAKQAIDLFQQACAQDDSFALAWTGIADANLLLYSLEKAPAYANKALNAAEQARDRNGKLPEVHLTLGSVYSATGRNAQAVEEIKNALELAPNSDDGYIRLAKAYQATGQTAPALQALKKAVELNPYYWYNHRQLGAGYLSVGNYKDALKAFNEQIAENPTDATGYNNLGATYLLQGRWNECIPAFNKAIQIHPSARAYTNLATANYMLGKYSDAVQGYKKALELSPNQAWIVANLALAYHRNGQQQLSDQTYDRAMTLLYQQLQVNPQDASALGDLALCYKAKGDIVRAHSIISRARTIDPSNSDLMYIAAMIDSANGHNEQALKILEKALRAGYSFASALSDPDLESLRKSPGFDVLRKEFGQTVADGRRR